MSIFDQCVFEARSALETAHVGASLASSLYQKTLTISLIGELGAGKTTFVQGFAKGLGVLCPVMSPSYALEQRYGDTLCHLDLYRLDSPEAQRFLDHSAEFPGVRIIEWGDRAIMQADIVIQIDPTSTSPPHSPSRSRDVASRSSGHLEESRHITIDFKDIQIPSIEEVQSWCTEVALPPHIARHGELVAEVCDTCSGVILKENTVIRKHALHAAALAHDLLRFVDFKASGGGPSFFVPTEEAVALWAKMKEKYPPPHESAAEKFAMNKGYPEIGQIIRTHRGWSPLLDEPRPETTEELVLAYADKRTTFEKTMSLDERFDDFIERYGNGKESDHARMWRQEMKRIERMLFPKGPPL